MNKSKICNSLDKKSLVVYVILNLLVILCLISEIINSNFNNILPCLLTLILLNLPSISENFFKIKISSNLKIMILLFCFASEIIGMVYNFYGTSKIFDKFIHSLNGFFCASIGFYLICLLNESNSNSKKRTFLKILMAFCFSMTISFFWEFYEYASDKMFKSDMQRDQYVYKIKSTLLDGKEKKDSIIINDIDHTILYDKNNSQLMMINGYLDIGLNDTMQDLIVNAIGAILFCVPKYLYMIDKKRFRFIESFRITKKKS